MLNKNKNIAILGAGGAGCCAALELANRGYSVCLFEKNPVAISEASYVNEGKIHLGFIYAMDTSLRTAQKMIDGALVFESNLQRWIDYKACDAISSPFYYGVHRESLLNVDGLLAHYQRCSDYYEERANQLGLDYLGMSSGCQFQLTAERNFPEAINPEYIPTIIETSEYAVDPRCVADSLRQAVLDHSGITFHPGHTVMSIEEKKSSGYCVNLEHQGQPVSYGFSVVVNTTWFRRLPLDKPLGIIPPGKWSHRYKFGNRVKVPLSPEQLPSITCVQGPFGDLVNFGERGFFLSWYPTGRTGMSVEESPPDWDGDYSPSGRRQVFDKSLEHWLHRCPALENIDFESPDIDPVGGVIYAIGTSDVDDRCSRLHDRYEVGIQSQRGYHTVDTGKYTLIPYWGVAIADRVEGLR